MELETAVRLYDMMYDRANAQNPPTPTVLKILDKLEQIILNELTHITPKGI